MVYSLINVSKRYKGRVDGNWMQDKTGTKEEAMQAARDTERANSNRISVAVVEGLGVTGASAFSYRTGLVEII
jgi:hypothetical protein